MSVHTYTRTKKSTGWDIDNPDHVDLNGVAIPLSDDIKVAFPSKSFSIRSSGTVTTVTFLDELTAPEITSLDGVISTHQSISLIRRVQNRKIKKIDRRTGRLIRAGFSYGGKIFSLSANAQRKLIGTHEIKDHPALTYPIEWNTKNDRDSIILSNPTDLDNFYLTGFGTVKALIDSGTALKGQVRSAVTKADVNAVVDNR